LNNYLNKGDCSLVMFGAMSSERFVTWLYSAVHNERRRHRDNFIFYISWCFLTNFLCVSWFSYACKKTRCY